ncbi:hypothetical protein FBEOM_10077 [Fusarium beomiforme]|uniref:Uncharacterized protein n=1 Tax=Fusarium beomiforme TaxID=44412 RepID=A0A9P5AC71_9HYPO|nr:hypothetical protein FBEOM_10077 [Fusarium beomiforme]
MAMYMMSIKVDNYTNVELKPIGTAFYPGCGEIQHEPKPVASATSGTPFVAQKNEKAGGLWGVAAYSTPDPGEILIIYFAIPEDGGSYNRCWVGTVPAETTIDPDFVKRCYFNPFQSFSEQKFIWEYRVEGGTRYALIVTPTIKDPRAWNTSLNVKVQLFYSVV